MKCEYAQLTSVGNRQNNEDYMAHVVTDEYALFVVADGLGGHKAGDKASQFFCQGLLARLPVYARLIRQDPKEVMAAWIDAAIDDMIALFAGSEEASDACTTCAVLYIENDLLVTVHCGDSRIYRLSADEIYWRTKDHSVTQDLLDKGEIAEYQMGLHPEQSRLTRCIDTRKSYEPEILVHEAAHSGETFILCTDGFWEHTKQREFLDLAQPQSDRSSLLKQAKIAFLRAGGKSDNITVQWVRIV
ncbi:MAG: PP2C family protein-serine/threonine phosphatase [Gammaproteobacteria bacterium]